MVAGESHIVTRRASADDFPAVLQLLRSALGWTDEDTRFLEWKHLRNPFGPSPMWIALAGERVVGFRAFLRWVFVGVDGHVRSAARAVDTATAPDFRGRGIFTALTRAAIDALRDDGVELVFNTPNRQSLSGYLRLGWCEVGRLEAEIRPARLRFAAVVLTARQAATRAPVTSALGVPAVEALGDATGVAELIAGAPEPPGLATRRSGDYLRWRYGLPDLGYRALVGGASPADGLLVFRLRRRGRAVEAVVAEVLVPGGEPRRAGVMLRELAGAREADYLIRLHDPRVTRDRFVRLPRMGPVLVCRSLTGAPVPDPPGWALSMGDVELL